jgi:hypothetical protein
VDYVFYAQNQVLSPKQAKHQLQHLRAGHSFVNTIG